MTVEQAPSSTFPAASTSATGPAAPEARNLGPATSRPAVTAEKRPRTTRCGGEYAVNPAAQGTPRTLPPQPPDARPRVSRPGSVGGQNEWRAGAGRPLRTTSWAG